MKVARKCPICNSMEAELLYNHKLRMAEKFAFMPTEYHIVSCDRCGNIYTSSEATQETYDRYYKTIHAYSVDKNTGTLTEDPYVIDGREKMIEILSEYVEPSVCIVDVGSGTGGALETFRKHGYNNLLGVDVDDKTASYAERGIMYRIGNVFNLSTIVPSEDRKFLFILNGVLEHIYDVRAAVESLARAMNTDSILYIMVPDVERYVEYYDKPFRYFGIEHINHFSVDILGDFLVKNGFAILESGRIESRYNKYCMEPEIYFVVSKEAEKKETKRITFHSSGKEKTKAYIAKSYEGYALDKIKELYDEQYEIVIWGVGSYLSAMLENTKLSECNISYLVDRNESLQGTYLNGFKINAPDLLRDFEGVIVIASAIYAESIRAEITDMELKNRIIVL